MAQNDIQITTTPPLPGLTLVQGINGALQSLATDFAGSIDPAAIGGVGPYCTWADTGNGLLKRRNAAGTDWVVEGKLLANNSAAENIDYDNAVSGLAAENVQDAIDELASEKLDIANAFGVGQTWQNVLASRASGVTYTNGTAKPIDVSITFGVISGNNGTFFVDGVQLAQSQSNSPDAHIFQIFMRVNPGEEYSFVLSSGTLYQWWEYR